MKLIKNTQSGDTALVHSLDGYGDEWEILRDNESDDNVLESRYDDDLKAFVPVAGLYADRRRYEYPDISDQLDAFWKGGDAAEAMRQRILAVKAKFPKP
jgi:hypothetical protein